MGYYNDGASLPYSFFFSLQPRDFLPRPWTRVLYIAYIYPRALLCVGVCVAASFPKVIIECARCYEKKKKGEVWVVECAERIYIYTAVEQF